MGLVMVGTWFQDTGGLSSQSTFWLTIFVGLVALSMLIQACVVLALGIGAMKAQKKLLAVVDDLKKKAMPIIDSTQDFVRETTPKVRTITDNVVEISHVARNKAHEFEATLSDANQKLKEATATFADATMKTRGQISRVDGMITSTLKATADLGATIHHSIQVPARQVAGVVTGFKTGLDVLLSKAKGLAGLQKSAPIYRKPL